MSSPSLSIRRANPDDWDALWSIWHEVVAAGDTYTYAPDTPKDTARRSWLAPAPDEAWLARTADARVVGTYHLAPNQPGPGSHVANASYMVAADARGLGVGRQLVEHSLERARTAGYLAVQFNAVAATNVHAIHLYERLGFTTVGVVPRAFRHPRDGLVGLHVMYREL